MTECDEVALIIAVKVGARVLAGLRSLDEARALVKLCMPDESSTIRENVACEVWAIVQAADKKMGAN